MRYNLLMAYSIDFRKKVLSYCERTGSITEASHVFQISRNTIYGWLKLKEKTGELNHQVKGTKPRKVDRDRLKNYLTDNPDAYLTEIASNLAVIQLPSTMRSKLWATLEKRTTPTMNKTQKK
uniref:Putative transposase n=1 Tax=Streptococcus pneumoniae TaxID=1313 RepID=Q9X998_STREE|nr:putative transposase [Streptococcus pneumoniae]